MAKAEIDPDDLGVELPPRNVLHVLEELPLLLDAPAAADFLGLGRSTFYRCDIRGLVPMAIRLGKLRRWSRIELREWVERGCPPRHRWEDLKKARLQ